MPRRTWRPIAIGIAALVLVGCQSTIAGSGHPAPGQAQPSTDTEEPEDTRLELVGTSTCEPASPTTRPGDGGSILSAKVDGTGHGLDVTIVLTKSVVNDRVEAVGIEVLKNGEIRDFGVLVAPGEFPYGYVYDPVRDVQSNLPNGVRADGTRMRFIVPSELMTDIGEEFQWYAFNELDEVGDYCPSLPEGERVHPTMSFPPQ